MGADPLLESLETLLQTKAPEPDEQQLRAAVAVLLFQIVRADAEVRHDEHLALGRTLQRVLGLTEEQADTADLIETELRARDEFLKNGL